MTRWTIADIAREAGVSTTTVSNFLNGRHKRMTPETRLRVDATIQRLNYCPSAVARYMKTGQVSLIALVLPTVANPYYGELAVAIESVAAEHGFQVLLCNTLRDKAREKAFAQDFVAYGVRRLISASAIYGHAELEWLSKQGVSCVVFDTPEQNEGASQVDYVAFDNHEATALAVRHLAMEGHSHIYYASAPIRTSTREARARGFLSEMARLNLEPARVIETLPLSSSSQFGDAELFKIGQSIAHEFDTLLDPPSAIVAMNDMVAIGMLLKFIEAGIEVPEQVSVVGLDNIYASTIVQPTLSTIRQPLKEMAEAALDLLQDRDSNRMRPSHTSFFLPEFISRKSVSRRCRLPLAYPECLNP